MRRALLLALAGLALGSAGAGAQSVAIVLAEFGMIGTWAASCTTPPSRDNIHSRFEVRGSEVVNVHDAGPTFLEDVFVVRSAKHAGIDLLLLQTVSKAGKESLITMRRIGDKMQVWRVVAADNSVPVNDGKVTADDAVIPALSKCK